MEHSDLTEKILDSCFNVMNDLGIGFLEAVYKNSLIVSLRKKNLFVETEKEYKISYHKQIVGFYRADIVVDDRLADDLVLTFGLQRRFGCQRDLRGILRELAIAQAAAARLFGHDTVFRATTGGIDTPALRRGSDEPRAA